jgi:predicted TIM-barrel fold metal-dependent hydrolase
MLPAVAHLIGEDRIVWGSDYPHFDSVFPGSVKTLEETISALPDGVKERIRGRNAVDLYRLPLSNT